MIIQEPPFSPERLNVIFQLDPRNPLHLISKENSRLEFKETFDWGSREKYIKTMASFANNKGGYIVYGVKDKPRIILGLRNDKFIDADGPEKVTEFLNSIFSPEIQWEYFIHKISSNTIGIIYIYESSSKPVVCIRNHGGLKESDIYYRYYGRSEKIKYPELKVLIDKEKEKEKRLWMRFIKNVSKIGISNVGILDSLKGEISGPGGDLLISEELLPQIQFIKEGNFSRSKGTPTLRLVGDVNPIRHDVIQPIKKIIQPRLIHAADIIVAFLDQKKVQDPLAYIKQICF